MNFSTYKTSQKFFLWACFILFGLVIKTFSQDVKGLEEAADEAFQKYEYAKAAKLYSKIMAFQPTNALAVSRLAFCNKENNNFSEAVKYYQKAISLPNNNPEDWLYFAEMLKSAGQYKEAKEIYRQYQINANKDVSNKIKGCDSAVYWISHPFGYMIENMRYLNTTKSDWGAIYNSLTNTVVFVSDSLRNKKEGMFKKSFNETLYGRTFNNFQKVYAISNEKNDPFQNKIHDYHAAFNKHDYHTGPVEFNAAYDSAYFTVTYSGSLKEFDREKPATKSNGGNSGIATRSLELYLTVLNNNGEWSAPEPFPYNNPKKYSVGHAAISKDGQRIYFTSDMPGGNGGLDIWYCDRLITGNWTLPRNCGPVLNSKEDDAFPVFGNDGNLYFASKGHIGMGGFDIFVTNGERNRWSKPLNMGFPINSSADDFYFFQKDEYGGFLSSNRKGGLGSDDIYQYTVVGTQPRANMLSRLMMEIKVIDNATKRALSNAEVIIYNTETNEKWEEKTNFGGQTFHEAEKPNPYAINAAKSGYFPAIVAVSTKDASGDTIHVLIPLDRDAISKTKGNAPAGNVYSLSDNVPRFHEGDLIRISNIHYDFDKDNIRRDASIILDSLVDLLNAYPSMTIELSSHTDSRGTDVYNENLADRRARSAVAYLVGRGIERSRLIAKGYGEYYLLNGCKDGVPCSEREHQENRRTEVKILRF